MLTYWETLIAKKSNITVSDSYAELWGKKSQSGYTVETYTGTLPATLQTVKGYLESYKIYGNTEQIGTPTPENPIVPQGCGVLETTGAHAGQYKLPLTSNSTPVDIYLGESQTTRRIKKLALTGNENFNKNTGSATNYLYYTPRNTLTNSISNTPIVCDRLLAVSSPPSAQIGINTINNYNMVYFNFGTDVMNAQPSGNTIDGFKEYLAAQYTAGTPVTVWYVLAEPETAVVNEPLMKIGDYADTIDSTQTSMQIPTAAGKTTISWAGEGLAPSEVELVYKVKR